VLLVLVDDNAADVLSIHKVLIALINFIPALDPGDAWLASTTTPDPGFLCPYS
jgi:hypothetical protein